MSHTILINLLLYGCSCSTSAYGRVSVWPSFFPPEEPQDPTYNYTLWAHPGLTIVKLFLRRAWEMHWNTHAMEHARCLDESQVGFVYKELSCFWKWNNNFRYHLIILAVKTSGILSCCETNRQFSIVELTPIHSLNNVNIHLKSQSAFYDHMWQCYK